MEEYLPCDILTEIITSYLNPRDRHCLSATSRRYRRLFPTPLRIQITSNESNVAVKQTFYVSPLNETATGYKMLSAHDDLLFGEDYVFWKYDFSRERKIYLSAGIVSIQATRDSQKRISVGLCSKTANILSFRVQGGQPGTKVQYGQDIGLEIGHLNPLQSLESRDRLCLSAQVPSTAAAPFVWSIKVQDGGDDETLQLSRHPACLSTKRSARLPKRRLSRFARITSRLRGLTGGTCSTCTPNIIKPLLHHGAVPDIVSEPFAVYSPKSVSLEDGNSACRIADDTLHFNVWVKDGYIYVQALGTHDDLSIAVPVLQNDKISDVQDTVGILQMLKRKESGRWAALRSYFAAVLDEQHGKPVGADALLRMLAGYHHTYTAHYDESRNNVSLYVAGLVVDTRIPNKPKKTDEVWELAALHSNSIFHWTKL